VKGLSEKEGTYVGKALGKKLEDYLKKHADKRILTASDLKEIERIIPEALADCVNDLDARLRKLEERKG
jgi:hypothetical protein